MTRTKQKAPELPKVRFDQYRLFKLGVGCLLVFGLLAFAAPFFFHTEVRVVGGAAEAAEVEELDAILEQLHASWDERVRDRVLEDAIGREHLVGHLHRVLRMAEHPLLAEAVELAGAFEAVELRPSLVLLATEGAAEVRPHAVRAADRLQPWEIGDFQLFFEDITPVQVAALEIARERGERSLGRDLGVPDPRAARSCELPARNAFSGALPDQATDALWSMVQLGSQQEEVEGLRVLAATDQVERFEPTLMAILGRTSSEGAVAVLEFLGTKDGPARRAGTWCGTWSWM